MTGVAQACQKILTLEGMATGSESPLHSTFIRAILLPPEMFTRPRQDVNDSFYDHDATQSECALRLVTIQLRRIIRDL